MSGTSEDREIIQAGYRYALSLSHDTHDAEDLVQQACLKVLQSRGSLMSRAYLFTAVRNLYIDVCRRRAAVPMHSLSEADAVQGRCSGAAATDDKDAVERLLSMLRPEEREILYLNCVEEFSASQIAELMGTPRGTVLSMLSRAKAKLKQRHSKQEVGGHVCDE